MCVPEYSKKIKRMNKMIQNKLKRNLIGLAALLFVVAAFVGYQKYIAPTKIGLINYPDFLFTKIAKSSDNKFIRLNHLHPDSLSNLKSYDMLVIFGMGIKITESETQKIVDASNNGTKVYLQASTNPNLQLTNIKGKQLDNVSDYLENGGKKNYRNLLNYVRREIDGKQLFTDTISAPKEIASDVVFYKDEEAAFEKVSEFEDYCRTNKFHKEGADKVILFTSVPGPFNTNREHLNSLIDELNSRNLNVYPIAGFRGRLKYMKEINPDLIVYMPHGRLSMGGSANAIGEWLKKQNVPVLCPISVFQKYDKWLKDKQGMFGGLLSQSVTMPEFDGGIVPYAVFAQYEDEKGYLLFKAIPDRLKKFGDIAQNYLQLKKQANKDKKVAIVYFKGPGKNAMIAANMEVLPSMHNLLLRLKKEGYDLGDLPSDFTQFKEQINRRGPVLGPYAKGAFEKYLKEGDPELIPAQEYEKWCEELIPKENYEEVVKRYGKAPGAYMSVYKNNTDYLAVTRLQYGNVALLPQPLPGLGENQFMLVHGAKIAPPHAYISPYLWIQKQFKADAIFHFGTHGSLEFTPGKQIALSNYDWTDPLIGTTPHFYIYTISNVGEGMIAKRRSYAATQTYLTPPFIEAQAFADRKIMHQKIHKYEQAKGALKREYALSVKAMAVKAGIHKDLELDSVLTKPYSKEKMMKLANYLEEIEHEKVTGGLYTMTVPYTKEKLKETIRLIFVDPLAHNLAEVDRLKGNLSEEQIANKMHFNEYYTHPSEGFINTVLKTGDATQMFQKIVATKDYQRAKNWRDRNKKKKSKHARRHPGSMSKKASSKGEVLEKERLELRSLIVRISTDTDKKAFIKKLDSEKEFEKASSMLDPVKKAKVQRLAKMIPAMKKALEVFEDDSIKRILTLMQKAELKKLALKFINDNGLKDEIEKERAVQDNLLLTRAVKSGMFSINTESAGTIQQKELNALYPLKSKLDFYVKNKASLLRAIENNKLIQNGELKVFLEKNVLSLNKVVEKRVKKLEQIEIAFSEAVFKVKETLEAVIEKSQLLADCPEYEVEAIVNALNGGYTAPSSGGDPIANPATIPTGRNLYAVNAEQTPTKEAWKVGQKLANSIIDDYRKKNDKKYPQKVSFTLWSSSFIETEGTTIAQILYFLGVEPIWSSFGRVKDIRLISVEKLKRPRIDVVVQTSGQLRDLAASRLFLINRAIAMAAEADDNEQNFVAKGVRDAESLLIEKGFSPKEARALSNKRIFGGVNGNYGTGIMDMVENSGRWDSTKAVAQTYINNMGAVYGGADEWGSHNEGVFEAALLNTEAVVQPRQSNTWGALSLDHVYEFMGGINLAVKEVTGNDAESYFNDFRNASNPRVQGLKEAIWVESRTTLLNPRYIKEYMKGGATSAENFAETFRNTFGWNVMKPSVIENRLWDKLYDVYVQDKLKLNIHQFFKRENPYALQEMTAVMLETVRKGYWKATPEQIKAMAQLHAQLVQNHEAGCSGFVCDNQKLKSFISKQLNSELNNKYEAEIEKILENNLTNDQENVVLKKEEKVTPKNMQSQKLATNKKVIWGAIALILSLALVFIVRRRHSN
ncbi:cobaltochelatase subunit CobN [Prolixibacteraceae bacterium JC049]|nr:cobaltochelatase subunit CobN [Prolixibacteraceae bacterium JC049]